MKPKKLEPSKIRLHLTHCRNELYLEMLGVLQEQQAIENGLSDSQPVGSEVL